MKNLSILLIGMGMLCTAAAQAQTGIQGADQILLNNYRPVSIYHTPVTSVTKAAYPVIDLHSHDDERTPAQVDEWIRVMDSTGIQRSVVLTYNTGKSFDSIVDKYKKYPDRFQIWCGFDYTGFGSKGWTEKALKELKRCYEKGARGVGEMGDKGLGELYSLPTPGKGVHVDDPALKPLFDFCAEKHMPVSIHVAEDQWMYEKVDSTNDGLINGAQWHVDMTPGKLTHDQLLATLEKVAQQHPTGTFIACHLANTCSNLSQLGAMFDRLPNLYADIGARFGELSPVPRYAAAFLNKYADRIVYGTDMGSAPAMYRITFRILESADEHFYNRDIFNYHWPLHGLALPKSTLEKIYRGNALRIIAKN